MKQFCGLGLNFVMVLLHEMSTGAICFRCFVYTSGFISLSNANNLYSVRTLTASCIALLTHLHFDRLCAPLFHYLYCLVRSSEQRPSNGQR